MKMNDFRLDGKIALVTGASYGIGFAMASGLARSEEHTSELQSQR